MRARVDLRGHTLHVLAGTPGGIYVVRMSAPGALSVWIYVAFLPGGIVIQGGAPFNGNGLVSVPGYGFSWFSGELSADYLASKFLRKGWHADLCETDLTGLAQESERVAAWVAENGKEFCSEYDFGNVWDVRLADKTPGYGYDPVEVEWLAAIQERFAELHKEQP